MHVGSFLERDKHYTNKVLTCDSGEIPMTEEYVVLPLPDSESNIK